MKPKWRDIPLSEINWEVPLGRCRAAHALRYSCREHQDKVRWSKMTLGELADKGERWWKSYSSDGWQIGEKAADLIKLTIDMAAAGKDVRMAIDRYVPTCERENAE